MVGVVISNKAILSFNIFNLYPAHHWTGNDLKEVLRANEVAHDR